MTGRIPTPIKPPDLRSQDSVVQQMIDYLWGKWRDDTQVFRAPQRLQAIADLPKLAMTVSNPPTQAEVQAIANKVDAIIAAAARSS